MWQLEPLINLLRIFDYEKLLPSFSAFKEHMASPQNTGNVKEVVTARGVIFTSDLVEIIKKEVEHPESRVHIANGAVIGESRNELFEGEKAAHELSDTRPPPCVFCCLFSWHDD